MNTISITDEHLLYSYLDEYMNANGIEPHLAGVDADGTPFLAWLNEEGGDSIYLTVTRLVVDDGGVTEHTVEEAPRQGESTSLVYPIQVIER